MARRKARVSPAQKAVGCAILALLVLITGWLLYAQSRFNPAVLVATRPPAPQDRPGAGGAKAGEALAALLPAVPGFTAMGSGESYGPDNLSDKINGKAELYLAAGFRAMSCRSYRLAPAGAHVEVFVYDMDSPGNAFAVFSGQRRPDARNLPLTAHAYATANALFFAQGRFYVEIVADRDSPEILTALKEYAGALLGNLPGAGPALDQTALFPPEGLDKDSVRLSASDVFGLEGLNQVYTGEYTLKNGKATAFVALREQADQAREEAGRYVAFLTENGYQAVAQPGLPGDMTVLALDNSFEIVFVEGRALAGVHDAASLEAALELAGRLRAALKGKQ
uniref:Uncharacterized protein n=1 Tax=Desulfobacca acetoxidans TaxID=60893 RepID=A0A7V4G763_9BACT